MIRYYIAPVIGLGIKGDPYRSSMSKFNVPFSSVIPSGPDGKPLFTWCLNVVNASSHLAILLDTEIFALPDLSLDIKLNAMANPVKQIVLNKLISLGIDTTIDGQTSYRDIFQRVGKKLDSSFDENNFWVI